MAFRGLSGFLSPVDSLLDVASLAVGHASRTVKFLRGRARFSPRPDDVYVASYPRSGTTWVLCIAHFIVSGAEDYDFDHLSSACPWWERSLAWRGEAAEDLETLSGPRVLKTHLVPDWLPSLGRVIHVTRDPADVALSYFHLYRQYVGFGGDFDEFFERFARGEVQYGAWYRHEAAWRKVDPGRVLSVTYEDLRAGPRVVIERIADFVGVTLGPGRAEAIAHLTSFDRMKREQARLDHEGELLHQWGVRTGDFVRSGQVGEGRQHITDDQRRRLSRQRGRTFVAPGAPWRLPSFLR